MRPRNDDEAIVDVLDVILRDGAMVQADVMIGIADIPLVGINLRAAIAGMHTMREYGYFETWDREIRERGLAGDEARHQPVATGDEIPDRSGGNSDG